MWHIKINKTTFSLVTDCWQLWVRWVISIVLTFTYSTLSKNINDCLDMQIAKYRENYFHMYRLAEKHISSYLLELVHSVGTMTITAGDNSDQQNNTWTVQYQTEVTSSTYQLPEHMLGFPLYLSLSILCKDNIDEVSRSRVIIDRKEKQSKALQQQEK